MDLSHDIKNQTEKLQKYDYLFWPILDLGSLEGYSDQEVIGYVVIFGGFIINTD